MKRAVVVRGRLTGPTHIELDEPVPGSGPVEVVVQLVRDEAHDDQPRDILDFLRSLPLGTRSKEDIDAQIAASRPAR